MKKFYAMLWLAIASLTQLQSQAPQGRPLSVWHGETLWKQGLVCCIGAWSLFGAASLSTVLFGDGRRRSWRRAARPGAHLSPSRRTGRGAPAARLSAQRRGPAPCDSLATGPPGAAHWTGGSCSSEGVVRQPLFGARGRLCVFPRGSCSSEGVVR